MDGREKLWVERAAAGEIEWRSIPESMFDGGKYQFPHCDARVLHLPEKCVYCAKFTALQEERQRLNVSNTGETNRGFPCPADHARGQASLNSWHGNRALTQQQLDEEDRAWKKEMQTFFHGGPSDEHEDE